MSVTNFLEEVDRAAQVGLPSCAICTHYRTKGKARGHGRTYRAVCDKHSAVSHSLGTSQRADLYTLWADIARTCPDFDSCLDE